MKLSKIAFMAATLGIILATTGQTLQAGVCECPSKPKCATLNPCCKKECKPGLANRIASGTAMIFEGTGDAIGWTFRKIGDIF